MNTFWIARDLDETILQRFSMVSPSIAYNGEWVGMSIRLPPSRYPEIEPGECGEYGADGKLIHKFLGILKGQCRKFVGYNENRITLNISIPDGWHRVDNLGYKWKLGDLYYYVNLEAYISDEIDETIIIRKGEKPKVWQLIINNDMTEDELRYIYKQVINVKKIRK